jgi:hypothetical protein
VSTTKMRLMSFDRSNGLEQSGLESLDVTGRELFPNLPVERGPAKKLNVWVLVKRMRWTLSRRRPLQKDACRSCRAFARNFQEEQAPEATEQKCCATDSHCYRSG